MQESEIKAHLKELQLKFKGVEVTTQSIQALTDGENYSGVSQVLPVLLQELGEFQMALNALATSPTQKKVEKPKTKKVKPAPMPERGDDPVKEEEEEPEE
jgi:hypothetical protein